jgi:hypothetical protein
LSLLLLTLLPVASASAGRLWVTGHDADFHCRGGSQCHYVRQAVTYARGGAPDPSKPVLVLDTSDLDFPVALDNAFGAGVVPRTVMDPKSAAFASEPLTTDRYSAILVASDTTCGGCDLNIPSGSSDTPDSDAINARESAIASFFNQGGGLYANAGADHGNGDPSDGADVFYDFAPIPLGGLVVQPPFCLTDVGASLGLEDQGCPDASRHRGTEDDINCCATHNSFSEPPAGSAVKVAERDLGDDGVVSADDQAETLVAEGVIRDGEIVVEEEEPPPPPPSACASDNERPNLTIKSNQNRSLYRRGEKATVRIRASDESGLRRNPSKLARRLSTKEVGKARIRATAVDNCGRRRTRTFTYRVAAKPTVRVAGVSALGCRSSNFSASIAVRGRGASVRRVVVRLDGEVVRTSTKRSFSIPIAARRLRPGIHRVTVTATDRAGNRRVRSAVFSRCRPIAITLTG